jgi:hypothetical protein
MYCVFVPRGQTVHQNFYLTILQHLHNSSAKEQLALLHYNTHIKPNTSGSYSPDLYPANLFLFLNLKVSLKGYQFGFADKTQKMLWQPTSFLKIKSIMLGKMKISL